MEVLIKPEKEIEVCPYCGEEKKEKASCCGEVHFEKKEAA
jgi:hypothetical protein